MSADPSKDLELKSLLEARIRELCAQKGSILDTVSCVTIHGDWEISASTKGRTFSFGCDRRDGFLFCERVGASYIAFNLDSYEPYFAANEELLGLAAGLIAGALADPQFRGYEPRVI